MISLYKLQAFKQKYDRKPLKQQGGFDPRIQTRLDRISAWMQQNNYTTKHMHETLDADGNGEVDAREFIDGLALLNIPQMQKKDFKMVFEAIDLNNNTYLSLNEFSLHLEGAKLTRDARISALPPEIQRDIEEQIDQLFELFDDNNDGSIDKWELVKTFQGLGHEMTVEKAEEMIASVDDNGDKVIDRQEFR